MPTLKQLWQQIPASKEVLIHTFAAAATWEQFGNLSDKRVLKWLLYERTGLVGLRVAFKAAPGTSYYTLAPGQSLSCDIQLMNDLYVYTTGAIGDIAELMIAYT